LSARRPLRRSPTVTDAARSPPSEPVVKISSLRQNQEPRHQREAAAYLARKIVPTPCNRANFVNRMG
jgi:hypothetical protein